MTDFHVKKKMILFEQKLAQEAIIFICILALFVQSALSHEFKIFLWYFTDDNIWLSRKNWRIKTQDNF